jgi:hypothetical protein
MGSRRHNNWKKQNTVRGIMAIKGQEKWTIADFQKHFTCHNDLSQTPVRKTDTFSQCANWLPFYFVGFS